KLLLLARMRIHRGDLLQLGTQPRRLGGPLVASLSELGHASAQLLPLAMRGAVLAKSLRDLLAAEAVEGIPLRRGRPQSQLLGLAVHGEQPPGQPAQAADEIGRASCRERE